MTRIFLIIWFIFTAAPAHGLVIELKPAAEVKEAAVTLGDIGRFDEDSELSRTLASQPVAQAPSPGQEIILQARSVIDRISRHLAGNTSVDWRGAAAIRVTRSANLISSAQILGIIDTYLQEKKAQLPKAEIRFIPAAQPLPFSVPAGKLTWQVTPSDPKIIGSTRFSLIFSVDGRVRKNMSVHGRLEILTQVVVAAAPLRKGTVLGPEHLAVSRQDIRNLRSPCLDPGNILGKKLKASVKAGSAIGLHQVEFPPLIKRGELVRMIVKRGSLMVTATGIAKNNGSMDQTIRVQNTESHRTVYCRVAAPGVVEVVL